ncbi:MAG: gamma carbonic anhydrase family protein [Sphaerochaetaceae bacterium]
MLIPYVNEYPEVKDACFIADSAHVIGEVIAKKDVSIWYNAVLRADNAPITLGERTNIQDNVVMHVNEGEPVVIGDDVTVGHSAIVHACTIGNRCLIGMGSIILDNAIIGDDTLVAAGSVVPPNKSFPAGVLLVGSPARVIRKLKESELEYIRKNGIHYVDIALKHKKSQK